DKFQRLNGEIAKTAVGAEQAVPWEYWADISQLLEKLKAEGRQLIALEQWPSSVNYKQIKLSQPTSIVVGNEVEGVDQEILKLCDAVVEIPMHGQKESLNVAVATGILLFQLLDS